MRLAVVCVGRPVLGKPLASRRRDLYRHNATAGVFKPDDRFPFLPACGLLRIMEPIFGNDNLEEPLMCERVKSGRIKGEGPHRGQKVLQHRMIDIAVIGFEKCLDSGERFRAAPPQDAAGSG